MLRHRSLGISLACLFLVQYTLAFTGIQTVRLRQSFAHGASVCVAGTSRGLEGLSLVQTLPKPLLMECGKVTSTKTRMCVAEAVAEDEGFATFKCDCVVEIDSEAHFQSILDGDRGGENTVVLEAYAPWCRKCLKMNKELSKVCKEFSDQGVVFLKMNSKALPEFSQKLGVRGMPTFIVFKNGMRVDHFNAGSGEELAETLRDLI